MPLIVLGSGLIVEVYPAAGLNRWGLRHRAYKGSDCRSSLNELVDRLQQAASWLRLGDLEPDCRRSDHVLDAVVCALLARAVALNLTAPLPGNQRAQARREGWIAIPTCALDQLQP